MFKPLNRYVQINLENPEENKTDSGILLPEEYKPTEETYATATVMNFSDDVKFANRLFEGCKVVVDKKMVEKINFSNKSINVVLENYIVGILS